MATIHTDKAFGRQTPIGVLSTSMVYLLIMVPRSLDRCVIPKSLSIAKLKFARITLAKECCFSEGLFPFRLLVSLLFVTPNSGSYFIR